MEKNIAYEASAGSGKTFMLVVRYLSLLFEGVESSKILALTFTNKAANEMYERIVATLQKLEEKDELYEIVQNTSLTKEEILAKKSSVLQSFLKSRAKIITIDSFLASILRKFSLYVGVMPDFKTVTSLQNSLFMERFLGELEVDGKQKELIALAIETQQRIGNIFALLEEFYKKLKELEKFSFSYTNLEPLKDEALTIVEKLRGCIQRCENSSKHAQNAFVVEEFADIAQKSWFGRTSLNYRTFSKCFEPNMDILLDELYVVMLQYFKAKEGNFFYHLYRLSGYYHKAKQKLIRAKNEVSFDDVTLFVYEILLNQIESEFLYFRLDGTLEHILLDEFQDTSIMQYEILHPLINEALSGVGVAQEGSLFFVGDVKQSIYRFRGGVSALFGEVARLNGTTVKKLLTNYRSQSHVVDFVNNVFKEQIQGYTPQKVRDTSNGGYVEVLESEELLESVFQTVKKLKNFGAVDENIAILCATNSDGKAVEEYLQERGYRVLTETTSKLIAQKNIQMLYEYALYIYFKQPINLKNFQTLSGVCGDVVLVDTLNKTPLEIFTQSIERYNLFDGDRNIIKFLEIVSGYTTLEEFIFEFDSIDVQAQQSTLNGIRILTVHKSKGLEFEHVVVMDRLTKEPPQRAAILYNYEGINLKGVYLRQKSRESIDKEYANVLEENKKLQKEDKLNALYVAFTRAKQDLFVVVKQEKSSFALLGLTPQTKGELVRYVKQEQSEEVVYEKLKYKPLYYGSQTNVLEQPKTKEQNLESVYFGLAMHYMLEMTEFNNPASYGFAKEITRNKYALLLSKEQFLQVQKRVEKLLKNQFFRELVGESYFKEQPVLYLKKLYYIDLLIDKGEEGFVVLDYKSSRHLHSEYVEQVKLYMRAVAAITKKNVKGYICYLLEDSTKFVEL